MATVGEQLRHAREQAGLTLLDVADETRIQRWILADIERDDLSRVPGGVFIRGYLTAFARAVGLNGERICADFRADSPIPAAEPAPVPARHVPGVGPWTIVRVAAIVLVAAVIWRNTSRSNSDSASAAPAPPALQERSADIVPASVPTSGTVKETVAAVDARPAERTTPVSAPAITVHLHASSDVWIDAKTDGEQRVYRLVMAGEDISLDARTGIVLLVGDAAAVSYTINGKPGRPLGEPGIVREIAISPDNYSTLLDTTS